MTEIVAEADALPTAPSAPARIADDRAWLRESAALAQKMVYAPPIGEGVGPYQLTPAYEAGARKTARDRAALAGRRLAVMLNRALARR